MAPKTKLRQLISENKIEEVICLLENYPGLENSILQDQLLIHKSNFFDLRKRRNLGIISVEKSVMLSNQIQYGILQIINDLSIQSDSKIHQKTDQLDLFRWFLDSRYKYFLTGLFAVVYLLVAYIKWSSFDSALLYVLAPFTLLGLSLGIFISSLPIKKPLRFSFFSTMMIPLICFLSEVVFYLLSTPLFAGGGGEVSISEILSNPETLVINIILLSLGGLLFGGISICGCYLGIGINQFFKNYLPLLFIKKVEKIGFSSAEWERKVIHLSVLLTRMVAIILICLPALRSLFS